MTETKRGRKIKEMPCLTFRRVQCDHEGRGDSGKRLKDLYITKLSNGQGYLITNFGGSMVIVQGKDPFPLPVYEAE